MDLHYKEANKRNIIKNIIDCLSQSLLTGAANSVVRGGCD